VATTLSSLAGVGLVSPAAAHDYLVSSVPEQGETVQAPPTEVSLEFNTSIGERFAQVAVVDDAGTTFQVGEPVVSGPSLTQAVDGLQPGMAVTISYRVVSSDGHPIGGTVPFAVAAAAGEQNPPAPPPPQPDADDGETAATTRAAPATTTDRTTETAATSSEDSSTVSPVVWVAAAAVTVLLAGAALTLSRRRARASTSP
jgi:methionine-rich copper-binding protein CopC